MPDRFLSFMSRLAGEERSGLYTPELRGSITGQAARERFRSLYAQDDCPPGLTAGMYFAYMTFLPDEIIALSVRLAMAHSLESPVAFLDHALSARVFLLPHLLKISWWRYNR